MDNNLDNVTIVGPLNTLIGLKRPGQLQLEPWPTHAGALIKINLGASVLACAPVDLNSWSGFCLSPSPVIAGLCPSVGLVMTCGLTFHRDCQPASAP